MGWPASSLGLGWLRWSLRSAGSLLGLNGLGWPRRSGNWLSVSWGTDEAMNLSSAYTPAWDYSHSGGPRISESSKKRQTSMRKLFPKLSLRCVCSCPISPSMSHSQTQDHCMVTRNCWRILLQLSTKAEVRCRSHERPRLGEKEEHNARMVLEVANFVGRRALGWGSLLPMDSFSSLK